MTTLAFNFNLFNLFKYWNNTETIENELFKLPENIPGKKYDEWDVPNSFLNKIKYINLDLLNINVNDSYKSKINFEVLHFETNNLSKTKSLIILPGFSSDSLKMTISRFYKYQDLVKEKGFTDVYIFNFTGIGGKEKKNFNGDLKCSNIQSILNYKIDTMYKKIASHLKNQIIKQKWKNISLLGRSAGGGLSLHLVFTNKLIINHLSLASPGFNCDIGILEKIKKYSNKELNLKLFWAEHDKKNEFHHKGGNQIHSLFEIYYPNYRLLWDNCAFGVYNTHRISKQNYQHLI